MIPLSIGQKTLLEQIFAALNRENLPVLVLRNYEGFPENAGRDIDLFLRKSDCPRAEEIISQVLRSAKGELCHIYRRSHLVALYLRPPASDDILHIDLYHGAFAWAGIRYLDDDTVFANSSLFNQIPIPGKAHEAAVLLLASVLDGGFVKTRYLPRIVKFLADPDTLSEFKSLLTQAFGNQETGDLLSVIQGRQDPNREALPVKALSSRLRKSMLYRSFLKHPCQTARQVFTFLGWEVRRILRPSGLSVVIVGPDGAGKSSVIAAVSERLNEKFCKTVPLHWRPGFLPDIGVLLGQRERPKGASTANDNPHGKTLHSRIASFFRLAYYGVDYWVGYFWVVRRQTGKNRIVIFDRYSFDMACDPRRFRLKLPQWMLNLFVALTPKPDLSIGLCASGEIFYNRKPEVSLEESCRQDDCFRQTVSAQTMGIVVDASLPLPEVIERVYAVITSELRQRASKEERV